MNFAGTILIEILLKFSDSILDVTFVTIGSTAIVLESLKISQNL